MKLAQQLAHEIQPGAGRPAIVGERQPLADMAEFCGRIAAGCDARLDDNFSIVARVEALIAGTPWPEGLAALGVTAANLRPERLFQF